MAGITRGSCFRLGVLDWIGVVFIALKLAGVIAWPWWAVTAPIWGPLALWLALVFLRGLWDG